MRALGWCERNLVARYAAAVGVEGAATTGTTTGTGASMSSHRLTASHVAVLCAIAASHGRCPQPRDVRDAVWPDAKTDCPARVALARLARRGLVRALDGATGTFVAGGGRQYVLTQAGREALALYEAEVPA